METETEMAEMNAQSNNSSTEEIAYDEELASGSEEALDFGMALHFTTHDLYNVLVHYLTLWTTESECDNFGAELSWKELKVTTPDGKKVLLHDACGAVKGRFLAVMGPSGSGKVCCLAEIGTRLLLWFDCFFYI